MASEKKISEGNECIQQAEKYLKTSFLKWKPDFDSAALEYSKAATCFKTGKALGQCKDCHLKAADCYSKNNSFFSAAKSYEQAALISRDLADFNGCVRLLERACQLFREHGTPDTAAMALEKAAKIVENNNPEVALDLYTKAADIVMIEDRPEQASEYVGKASRILLKLNRLEEAAESVRRERQMRDMKAAGRLVVAEVLIHLARDDQVAAEKAFRDGAGYCENDEVDLLSNLLEGVDMQDAQQRNRALKSPFITHMDVEYARLARSLVIPETEEKSRAKKGADENVDEDDEFSGGLL